MRFPRGRLPWIVLASACTSLLCGLQGCRVRPDEPALDTDAGAIDAGADATADADANAAPEEGEGGADAEPPPDVPEGAAVVAFGGIGSEPAQSAEVLTAVRAAVAVLAEMPDPMLASIRGAALLEDDPRLNAGTGSSVRVDGMSVQMDAAVMDSRGRFAAVGAIERVRNPVLIAHALLDTPHTLLVGDGATAFARSLDFGDHEPLTDAALERRALAMLLAAGVDAGSADASVEDAALPLEDAAPPSQDAAAVDAAAAVSDAGPGPPDAAADADAVDVVDAAAPALDGGADTIAVLVRGADGALAGAVSSGGPELALRGRVGDVVVPGAALFVGPKGAVAVSGRGDKLYGLGLAQRVYDHMVLTRSPKLAVVWGLAQAPAGQEVGIAALDRRASYVGSTVPMAWAEATTKGERTAEAAP